MKSPLSTVLIIVAVALVIFAGVKYFDTNEPPPAVEKPVVTSEAKLPATQSSPSEPGTPAVSSTASLTATAPTSLEQNYANLQEAVAEVIASGESKEVTLVITEAEANEQAASLLTQATVPEDIPLELKGVQIDFQTGNNVLTEIETTTMGITVKIKVKSHVGIEEGRPAVDVTEINFGFIPLPGSLKDQISSLIRQNTEDLLDQLTTAALASGQEVDIIYQDIDIQDEKATFTVLIRPEA